MDMHQADTTAEWLAIPASDRTVWQRIAHATNGVVTPGNIMSVIGLVMVVCGLLMLVRQQYVASFLLVGIGRIADILDGAIAHATKTKSPLGEALDAGIDKIELAAAMVALFIAQLAPIWLLTAVVIVNGCIAFVSAMAKARHVTLHPVRTGKLATFILWISFGMYIGYAAFNIASMELGGILSLLAAAIMSMIALGKYVCHVEKTPY